MGLIDAGASETPLTEFRPTAKHPPLERRVWA